MPRRVPRRTRSLRVATPLFFSTAIALATLGVGVARGAGPDIPVPQLAAGPANGIVHARDAGRASTGGNLIWHNGQILTAGSIHAIYWGTSWTPSAPKISGLASLYAGFGSSRYMGTNTEYTGTNGQVTSSVTFDPTPAIDTSAASRRAPSTSTVLAVVARNIPSPVPNGYYPVYSDQPRGHAGYCAWHSYGTINGVPVQFAFFFNLDGDPGCDPGDTSTGHSEGLAALGNVSGHELSEAVTDPRSGGWYDSAGAENADKCAWTFGHPYLTLSNGTTWKIQGNYSNAAAATRSGYDGAGCIDGN